MSQESSLTLSQNFVNFRSLLSLLRELLASAVFLTAADKLSDPVSLKRVCAEICLVTLVFLR